MITPFFLVFDADKGTLSAPFADKQLALAEADKWAATRPTNIFVLKTITHVQGTTTVKAVRTPLDTTP